MSEIKRSRCSINKESCPITNQGEHTAVTNFREYLRIPSVLPNADYEGCVTFLKKQADSLGLPIKVHSVVLGKPVVIITWTGLEPEQQSLLLNSHMDVVPVYPDQWTHDPFGAEKDENGNIYARGAQDMKCVGIQYLETIRRFIADGKRCKRTIHVSFVPDEEIGGKDGMGVFVTTEEFKKLNVGCALDEGNPSPTEVFPLFNAERTIWQMRITCPGTPGHASLLHDNTAAEKVNFIINKFMTVRQEEKNKLQANKNLTIGDVTTVNITMMSGGVQLNVLPPKFILAVDCRLSLDRDLDQFLAMINGWCKEAGEGTKVEFILKGNHIPPTPLNEKNKWWTTLKGQLDTLKLEVKPQTMPGVTDSRFLRDIGIPAFGFSPMNPTYQTQPVDNFYSDLDKADFSNGQVVAKQINDWPPRKDRTLEKAG
uniref:N-acyl-aliphatic-L-amino acid amidohydrolase n=1 Tax=Cacopsylla melanoneura TaxID=428564 RepID=A0A8D9ADR6_9HEMI